MLEDEDKIWKWESFRVKKYNRSTYALNGIYELKQPFTDEMILEIVGLNFNGGQYKKVFEKNLEKPRETLQQHFSRAFTQ